MTTPLVEPPLVELNEVSVVRDGKTILDGLSLKIHLRGHMAILGPNGCGKSTLIKLLTREIHPFAGRGSIRILGEDRWLQRKLRTVLGVVSGEPKEPLLGDPTVLDLAVSGLLGTYGVLWGSEISAEMLDLGRAALESVDAGHLADRKLGCLSAGEYRRAFIARALVCNPTALVLDEPTTSLDIKAAHEFRLMMSRLAAMGKTLILVTHHLEEIVPEIERVVLMRSGRIVADGPTDEILDDRRLSETFSAEVRLLSRAPYTAVLAAS